MTRSSLTLPYCMAIQTSAYQTITSGSANEATVRLDSVETKSDSSMFDNANDCIVINTTGKYSIIGSVHDQGEVTPQSSYRYLKVQCDQGFGYFDFLYPSLSRGDPTANLDTIICVTSMARLTKGWKLRLRYAQNSGETLTLGATTKLGVAMLPIK